MFKTIFEGAIETCGDMLKDMPSNLHRDFEVMEMFFLQHSSYF